MLPLCFLSFPPSLFSFILRLPWARDSPELICAFPPVGLTRRATSIEAAKGFYRSAQASIEALGASVEVLRVLKYPLKAERAQLL